MYISNIHEIICNILDLGIPRCANPESWSPQKVDDLLNRRNDVDLHAALCLFPHVRTKVPM